MTEPRSFGWRALRDARRPGELVPIASKGAWREIHEGLKHVRRRRDRLVQLRGWHCWECWLAGRKQRDPRRFV